MSINWESIGDFTDVSTNYTGFLELLRRESDYTGLLRIWALVLNLVDLELVFKNINKYTTKIRMEVQ